MISSCTNAHQTDPQPESTAGEGVQRIYLYPDSDIPGKKYDQTFSGSARWNREEIQELKHIRIEKDEAEFPGSGVLKLHFPEPQDRLFGSKWLNLHSLYADPSGMRQILASKMFNELDQPAPQTRYIVLFIDDVYEGLGIHIALADSRTNGQYDSESEFPVLPDLEELKQWARDTPAGDAFYAGIRERFGLEKLTDLLCVYSIMGTVHLYDEEFHLYKEQREDSLWNVIPAVSHRSFGKNLREELQETQRPITPMLNDYFAYEYPIDESEVTNSLIVKFHQTPQLREQFGKRLLYLMDEVFTPNWFDTRIDKLEEKIGAYMQRTDGFERRRGQHHSPAETWPYHVEALRDFIELRYAFIRSMLLFDRPVAWHNRVEMRLSSEDSGRILFTDDAGWTIAAIDIEPDGIQGNPEVLLYLTPDHENDGITQNWHAEVEGGSISGTITLYYRNDIAPDGRDNYYMHDDAVGRQWELELFLDGTAVDSRPNPFSNKVTAEVRLSGSHILQLLHGE